MSVRFPIFIGYMSCSPAFLLVFKKHSQIALTQQSQVRMLLTWSTLWGWKHTQQEVCYRTYYMACCLGREFCNIIIKIPYKNRSEGVQRKAICNAQQYILLSIHNQERYLSVLLSTSGDTPTSIHPWKFSFSNEQLGPKTNHMWA